MFLGSMGGADAISRDRCRYIALSRFRFLSRCVSLSFLISVATPFYIDFPVKNMYIYIYIHIFQNRIHAFRMVCGGGPLATSNSATAFLLAIFCNNMALQHSAQSRTIPKPTI